MVCTLQGVPSNRSLVGVHTVLQELMVLVTCKEGLSVRYQDLVNVTQSCGAIPHCQHQHFGYTTSTPNNDALTLDHVGVAGG